MAEFRERPSADERSPAPPRTPSIPPGSRFVGNELTGPVDSDAPVNSAFEGEDFLYHLFRGSELLQDNCVSEAKEELERALRMQPRDVEGQGLLGVVYFRLGLYPRAIEIYEEIIRACPHEITPRINVALCYLKTGQAGLARDALEDVTQRLPDHERAWGYLGLTYERLRDYGKAQAAFLRANQPHLARRMEELSARTSQPPDDDGQERGEVRRAAADAVQELDTAEEAPPFSRAKQEPELGPSRSGRWRAVEPGEADVPSFPKARRSPSLVGRFGPAVPAVPDPAEITAPPSVRPGPPSPSLGTEALLASTLLDPPELPARVAISPTGLGIIRVSDGLMVRGEALRSVIPNGKPFMPSPLFRRLRGRETQDPFGVAASWFLLEGAGSIVIAPAREHRLFSVDLNDEYIYVREQLLVAFDATARYENGRLPSGGAEPIAMVQLTGTCAVLIEVKRTVQALAVGSDGLVVRAEDIVGWTGRMLSTPVAPEHAPTRSPGFVAFSGDGAVLLDVG
jgi:Tetratricopeptide repeat